MLRGGVFAQKAAVSLSSPARLILRVVYFFG